MHKNIVKSVSTISLVINNSLVENFWVSYCPMMIKIPSQRNRNKFPMMMTLSLKSAQNSLPWVLPDKSYHWRLTNSINFEFVCSILLIPPIHEYSTVRKRQCSVFTGDKQLDQWTDFQYQIPLMSKFPVLSIWALLCQIWPTFKQKSSLVLVQSRSLGMIQNMLFQYSLNLHIHLVTRSELQFS